MAQDADFPLDVVTVIVAVPALMPLTTPAEVTVAMFVSLDFHLSVVVASDGVIVGVKVIVVPSFMVSLSGRDMPVGDFPNSNLTAGRAVDAV